MKMMHVRLFNSNKRIFDGMASVVVLPSESGEVSVLDFHAPMLCVLTEGKVQIDEDSFDVRRGIARVEHNGVTVMAY